MKPLLVIVGPTASGKSAVAMDIAKRFNGEIICADSRTVYKGMDIGTAKPSLEDQKSIKHHLLDVVNPDQSFTVADFKRLANKAIAEISQRGKLPILVGGSGMYVDAVLFDYKFSAADAPRDPSNPRHVAKSEPQQRSELRQNTIIIGLNPPLELLKQRIIDRVEVMVKNGFAEEVKELTSKNDSKVKALHAPGYKAFSEYMSGAISLDEAKARFARNDYLLARRQRTWFKRNKSIHWMDNREDAVDFVTTLMNKKQ